MSKQNLAKSTVWLIISELIFNLSGYLIHSFVGRILGPADYGRYGLVITLTTMVIILIGNGIPTAMSKYMSEIFETNPSLIPTLKRQAIIMQSLLIGSLTLIFYLCAPLIANVLGDPSLTQLFKLSTWVIPTFAAASFYFSYYTGFHQFNLQSIMKTVRSVFKVIIIIWMAWIWGVAGAVAGYAASTVAVWIIAAVIDKTIFSKQLKQRIQAQIENAPETVKTDFDWHKLVNYAWQIVVFFLAYQLFTSIDLYLVKGLLHNDYQTGIYNAALTVGNIPYYIFYALTIMLLPVISKTTSENNLKETNKVISNSMRLMVILLIPSVILISQFSHPVMKLLYSSKYVSAGDPMAILAYGVGFLTIFYVMSFVLNGAGKTKIPMWISIFGLAVNTTLNYFLIPRFALLGSASATTITAFFATLIMIYYLQRDFGKLMEFKSLVKMLFAGMLMYLTSRLFSQGEFIFVLWSLILFAEYLIILFFLKEITQKDIVFLAETLSKKKKKKQIREELSGNEPTA